MASVLKVLLTIDIVESVFDRMIIVKFSAQNKQAWYVDAHM